MATADTVLSYYTDYTQNFLQVSTTNSIVSSILLYLASDYDPGNQVLAIYKTPADPSDDDAQILTDLTYGSATNLKVSFSYLYNGSTKLFSIFIMKVGLTTSIIRYRWATSSGSASQSIASNSLNFDFKLDLSTDAQTLFDAKMSTVQVMTFEL